MIICEFDIKGIAIHEPEADAPLVIYGDRQLPFSLPLHDSYPRFRRTQFSWESGFQSLVSIDAIIALMQNAGLASVRQINSRRTYVTNILSLIPYSAATDISCSSQEKRGSAPYFYQANRELSCLRRPHELAD